MIVWLMPSRISERRSELDFPQPLPRGGARGDGRLDSGGRDARETEIGVANGRNRGIGEHGNHVGEIAGLEQHDHRDKVDEAGKVCSVSQDGHDAAATRLRDAQMPRGMPIMTLSTVALVTR